VANREQGIHNHCIALHHALLYYVLPNGIADSFAVTNPDAYFRRYSDAGTDGSETERESTSE
jgi:hypothetical protein